MTNKLTPHLLTITEETQNLDLARQGISIKLGGLIEFKDSVICARDQCIVEKDKEIAHWKTKVSYLTEMTKEIQRLNRLQKEQKAENMADKVRIVKLEEVCSDLTQ